MVCAGENASLTTGFEAMPYRPTRIFLPRFDALYRTMLGTPGSSEHFLLEVLIC
jgi:hypothetical protein